MSWQISEHEFLIRGWSYPIYLSLSVNRVRLPDGTLINSANEYFRVSADGIVLEWYAGPSTSTLEECLYVINIHAVVQTSLYKFPWIECYGREAQLEEKICLPHLEPVPEPALPFDPIQVIETFHRDRSGQRKGAE
jgi:hypothetical protein